LDGREVSVGDPDSPRSSGRARRHRARAAAQTRAGSATCELPVGALLSPDPRNHALEQAASVTSILMELDTRRMVADGQPCTVPYRELDYGEFLSKPRRFAAAEPVA
jgi:hypothetical protein